MTPWLISVAMLSLVMSATPGPNNVIFASLGARVGLVKTVPALAGMLIGFLVVIVLCALGIGTLVGDAHALQVVLGAAAASYMLWLAWRLWTSARAIPTSSDTPNVSAPTMVALQAVNPKTWLASVAFVSGFLGPRSPGGPWVDALGIGTFLVVVTMSATSWTVFGASLRTRLDAGGYLVFYRCLSIVAALTGLHLLVSVV